MSVLILILKIIGCLLLVLLGLILVLFLAVMFWPVGYRITGRIENEIDLNAKMHWLCYIISFRFVMENGDQIAVLRIFGFPIQIYPVVEKKPKKRKKRKKKQPKEEKDAAEDSLPMEEVPGSKADGNETEADGHKKQDAEDFTQADAAEENLFDKIKTAVTSLSEKIKGIFSRITDIKTQLWDENNRKILNLILKEIKNLLLHYHPRKIKADIHYATGDPAWTGELLGILSMIPFLYQKKVQIAPDFLSETPYFKGSFDVRGRIRMIHLIRSGLHIWKDKNVKTIIKKRRS